MNKSLNPIWVRGCDPWVIISDPLKLGAFLNLKIKFCIWDQPNLYFPTTRDPLAQLFLHNKETSTKCELLLCKSY